MGESTPTLEDSLEDSLDLANNNFSDYRSVLISCDFSDFERQHVATIFVEIG